jgi:hypothetical protein
MFIAFAFTWTSSLVIRLSLLALAYSLIAHLLSGQGFV